jgi:hypothetical protein
MSGTISALLGKFEVCLAQSQSMRALCRAGKPQCRHHRNLKLDVHRPPTLPGWSA